MEAVSERMDNSGGEREWKYAECSPRTGLKIYVYLNKQFPEFRGEAVRFVPKHAQTLFSFSRDSDADVRTPCTWASSSSPITGQNCAEWSGQTGG